MQRDNHNRQLMAGAATSASVTSARSATTLPPFDNATANDSLHWYEPAYERDPPHIIIPLSAMYVIVFVFGLLGNISTCIVIGRNRQMRTATNFYLFSLACSDLLLLISGLPLELHKIWFPYPYPFNEATCVIQGMSAETSANATVLTILLFTCERYIAIVHPLVKLQARRSALWVSRVFKAPVLLGGVWVASLLLAVPQAMQFGIVNPNEDIPDSPDLSECTIKHFFVRHAFLISTVVFFLAPLTVITILYLRIFVKLQEAKRHRIRSTAQDQNQGHVVKILVAVVLTFFMCWAPFHTQRLVAVYMHQGDTPEENERFKNIFNFITYLSGVLYFMSTMINPILYHSMSNKFRDAFWDTVYRDFHGFACLAIPEQWKKKQESRYNIRRGNREWSRRNGCAERAECTEQQSSYRRNRHSNSLFELLPMRSSPNPAACAASAEAETKMETLDSPIVDPSKLEALLQNGGSNQHGLVLPTLLRSHSLHASTPHRGRRRPPRRSCTVDVVTEVMRAQHDGLVSENDWPCQQKGCDSVALKENEYGLTPLSSWCFPHKQSKFPSMH
ncbi:pyrokinin-1 receptor-like [Thrips palmi]|uniref:Pyrokinin-1 receptor-like n=1 Tax=Thrips palmi TaxID=161013 RepID=A0A6P8ZQ13_THRPL|nr:pyrokinin-1 receptor-like [Thrips palmi]